MMSWMGVTTARGLYQRVPALGRLRTAALSPASLTRVDRLRPAREICNFLPSKSLRLDSYLFILFFKLKRTFISLQGSKFVSST